jgi:hypothetical protein
LIKKVFKKSPAPANVELGREFFHLDHILYRA